MTVRTLILGGSDWADGQVLYASDLVDTIKKSILVSSCGVAEISNKIHENVGSWKNSNITSEIFSNNASGLNGGVIIGSTTAFYTGSGPANGGFPNGSLMYGLNYTEFTTVATYSTTSNSISFAGSITQSGIFTRIPLEYNNAPNVPFNYNITKNGTIVVWGSGLTSLLNINPGSYTSHFVSGNKFVFTAACSGTGNVFTVTGAFSYTGSGFNYTGVGALPTFQSTSYQIMYENWVNPSGTLYLSRTTNSNWETISGITILSGSETNGTIYANGVYSGSELTFSLFDGTNTISGLMPNSIFSVASLGAGSLSLIANLNRTSIGSYSPTIKAVSLYLF